MMFQQIRRIPITMICMIGLPLGPAFAREGEGGFRGGGRPGGGGAAPHVEHATPHPEHASPHLEHAGPPVAGRSVPEFHGAVGIHGAEPIGHEHGPVVGGNHFGYAEHGGPPIHYAGSLHAPGPHWNSYHQAYIGNHPVHLAWGGYRPSYYYHPWYHGPWGGHSWGWGWGFGPGLAFGIGGGGFGVGIGSGWGYPGYYNPYGRYGYWGRPLGWGFGGWGLGTTVYSSGYYPYYNPYYSSVGYPNVVYNYAAPIPVAAQAPPNAYAGGATPTSDPSTNPPMNPAFDAAREAFMQGDYRRALSSVDVAISQSSSDAVMHEFRSLVLFALRDYKQSAGVIHSVLAVGPGWDWTTMSSLYPDPQIYSDQLRSLEGYVQQHPRAADAHFLLAYHDMIGSRRDAAAFELQQVVRLMPTDRLAGELLAMVKGPPKQAPLNNQGGDPNNSLPGDPNLPPPAPQEQADQSLPPIDQNLLPGTWNASRGDGSRFRLAMTTDGKFTWKYSTPNQTGEDFSGTYSVEGPVLTLERKGGGALAGTATFDGDRNMNFKLVGGPPEDKGLDFAK